MVLVASFLSCVFAICLVRTGNAKLNYITQTTLARPVSKQAFANQHWGADNSSIVEVRKKGGLIRWTQNIDGIPVYASVITTQSDYLGRIQKWEGFVAHSPVKIDPKPTITAAEALDLLKQKWNHASLTNVDWRLDQPEKYILPNVNGKPDKLVWRASYYVDWENGVRPQPGVGPVPAFILGLVNAHTGEVERTWNNLQSAIVKGVTGNDKTGASYQNMNVKKNGHWCWHKDDKRRVEVFHMGNLNFLSSNMTSSFICERAADKNWDRHSWTGGYSPRNEVYLYATKFVDLWTKLVGKEIPPYRNKKESLKLFTHYGYKVENAMFNGFFFLFGDGNTTFYPLTSMDVVCHEIGHSVTMWNGGKMEYQKESGALNEAYSDMLGMTCNMAYKKKTDYLIGSDIIRPGKGKALRDMCNPKSLGGLDHYKQYNDKVDVHLSSGIYNKAWCTLSKTKGWNYIRAFQVFTDANLMFWSEFTGMHCGACAARNAAEHRGWSKKDVTAAFKVVGVDCSRCIKPL